MSRSLSFRAQLIIVAISFASIIFPGFKVSVQLEIITYQAVFGTFLKSPLELATFQ